jgi:hypothetical protein
MFKLTDHHVFEFETCELRVAVHGRSWLVGNQIALRSCVLKLGIFGLRKSCNSNDGRSVGEKGRELAQRFGPFYH